MSTEFSSMDSLLDSAPAPAEPSAPVETTGDKPEASAPPAELPAIPDDGPMVPRKALEDERRKRQDYERRLQTYEAQLQAQRQQPRQEQPQQAPPDWYVEPEQAAQQMQREFQYQIFETRLSLGEEIVGQNAGYADAKNAFVEAAQADPSLLEKMVKHQNPAKFVFDQGRRLAAQREIGDDPIAYKERLRAELRAELGQAAPSPAISQPPKAPAPKSLAGTTSTSRDPQGRFATSSGPASLEDLLG